MRKSGDNAPMVQACKACGAPKLPHRVCMSCGVYNGKTVVAAKTAEE